MASSGQHSFLLHLSRTLVGSTCSSNKDLRGWGGGGGGGSPAHCRPLGCHPDSKALLDPALNVSMCHMHVSVICTYAQGGVGGLGGKGWTPMLGSGMMGGVWGPACSRPHVVSPHNPRGAWTRPPLPAGSLRSSSNWGYYLTEPSCQLDVCPLNQSCRMGSPSHPAALSVGGALQPSLEQFPALELLGSEVDLETRGQYQKFTVLPAW